MDPPFAVVVGLILLFTVCSCAEQDDFKCSVYENNKCGFGTERNNSYCECKEGYENLKRSDVTAVCSCSKRCSKDTRKQTCDNNAKCTKDFKCECRKGYQREKGHCVDVDECLTEPNPCGEVWKCINTQGRYSCICESGYTFKDKHCADINECDKSPPCGEHAYCTNTMGSYQCTCRTGYDTSNKSECSDVDECTADKSSCDEHANCTNVPGSFTCSCKDGYTGSGQECEDIDECAAGEDCGENGLCINAPGNFSCRCEPGYAYNTNNTCTDIDECAQHPCDAHAQCTNIPGSFQCSCNSGHTGSGAVCEDIDECAEDDACGPMSLCTNSDGSYQCFCLEGYAMNNTVCEDIDECSAGSHSCGDIADCQNTDGSHKCVCSDGYLGNGIICLGSTVVYVACALGLCVLLLVPAIVARFKKRGQSSYEVTEEGGNFELMATSVENSNTLQAGKETPAQLWDTTCKNRFSVDDLHSGYQPAYSKLKDGARDYDQTMSTVVTRLSVCSDVSFSSFSTNSDDTKCPPTYANVSIRTSV